MIKTYEDSIIYIFCPHNLTSGGADALHQLHYYLKANNYKTFMVYFFSGVVKCNERFEKYEPQIIRYEDIADDERNIVVAPESATYILREFKHVRKCIWWLGYVCYDGHHSKIKIAAKNTIKRVLNLFKSKKSTKYKYQRYAVRINDKIYNLCGSKFVYDKLKRKKYTNVVMMVEPLSLDFIQLGMSNDLVSDNRSKVIPYNPAKPSKIMDALLRRTDLDFVPIKGMSLPDIIDLFRHSRLYIDFGEFGGPERMPKESVYNGTCLLVGKHNAAVNDFDVAIPDKFKIEDSATEEYIVERIKDILENYDKYIGEFEYFRDKIDRLEQTFVQSIKTIFSTDKNKTNCG